MATQTKRSRGRPPKDSQVTTSPLPLALRRLGEDNKHVDFSPDVNSPSPATAINLSAIRMHNISTVLGANYQEVLRKLAANCLLVLPLILMLIVA